MATSSILEEGKEIVKWIRDKKVSVVATILLGPQLEVGKKLKT